MNELQISRHGIFTLLLIVCLSLFPHQIGSPSQTASPAYRDASVPIETRVDDLISRMSLEERVSQLGHSAPAIPRLGIPHYGWANEALHGVAWMGYATVFPQAIGLSATWNPDLVYKVADVISTEARAKHNEFILSGEGGPYQGLTFFSPNINIFRDPRWGRGQETYGEDPFLTSQLGVAYVQGMQGKDPRYLKVVATPKHFAVHSGPEPERHTFNATVSERDLRETYLPAFRATVVDGRTASVMCAYNRLKDEPCCANGRLLTNILRKEWGFRGYVVSDCGAIEDTYKEHHFAKSDEQASVLSIKAGTDLRCGRAFTSLVQAVKDGLISEAAIDASLKRVLTARFQLGMFDPPEMVPYARIPYSENDSRAHRDLALTAARESIVLLKNERRTLPLRKDLKTIAVIGPNANAPEVLLGNFSGQPSKSVTPLEGIQSKVSRSTRVLHALGSTLTGESAPVPSSALSLSGPGSPSGLKGEYFNNKESQGDPVLVRVDQQVDFDWGRGRPAPQLGLDNFSVRWTGKFTPSKSGTYQLGATANDGVRVYLDGTLLVDAWAWRESTKTFLNKVNLEAGRSYDIRLEYYENTRDAVAKFVWSFPQIKEELRNEAVDAARQADVVVAVLGISPTLEGEEMEVNLEGFRGGDRTDITLPKAQEQLLRAVWSTGKPVVLVLMNGSALAVNWANNHVPAIVDAWYPGEEGGTAVADVLFGDYNPAGRLPVTFYKSVQQLPPFDDYNMRGRTYRYFKGEPLYPFGFGLSYTKFKYSNLNLSSEKIKTNDSLVVSVDVENDGERSGDEVVQLYVTDLSASVPVPIRSLQGINRIFLKGGEKRRITFNLEPRQLSVIDDNGRRVIEPGTFLVSVGGKQPAFSGYLDAQASGVLSKRFLVTGTVAFIPEEMKSCSQRFARF